VFVEVFIKHNALNSYTFSKTTQNLNLDELELRLESKPPLEKCILN